MAYVRVLEKHRSVSGCIYGRGRYPYGKSGKCVAQVVGEAFELRDVGGGRVHALLPTRSFDIACTFCRGMGANELSGALDAVRRDRRGFGVVRILCMAQALELDRQFTQDVVDHLADERGVAKQAIAHLGRVEGLTGGRGR